MQNLMVQVPRKRSSLGLLLAFSMGVGVGFGIFYLDKHASIPKLGSTEVFEVTLPDGTVQRLTYAEIERNREELNQLRQQLARAAKPEAAAPSPVRPAGSEDKDKATAAQEPPEGSSGKMDSARPGSSRKNLGELFAKIFNRSLMDDLAQSQAKRQAGELADVLNLNPDQQKRIEEMIGARQKSRLGQRGSSASREPPGEELAANRPLEDEIRAVLTTEQASRYQEYTEKKNSFAASSPLDKEVFELTWRLSLSDDQEPKVREILQEHASRTKNLSTASPPDEGGESSYTERIENFLAQRKEQDKNTAETLKPVLDPDQFQRFLAYQQEKDMETQLFRKLLQEEAAKETPAPPQ